MSDTNVSSESHIRSIAKGVSYRCVGTLATAALSFMITGSARAAFLMGCAEVTTKVLLFWGHERVWGMIAWGRHPRGASRWSLRREASSVTSSPERAPTPSGASAE